MIAVLALMWMNCGPNGMPRLIVGYSAAMLYQNSSWTSTGVPRKNHTYSQLAARHQRVGREPHHREQDAERDAERLRGDRQLDRDHARRAVIRAVEQVVADVAPLEVAGCVAIELHDRDGDHQHDRGRHPPSRVADRDGLDVVGARRLLVRRAQRRCGHRVP